MKRFLRGYGYRILCYGLLTLAALFFVFPFYWMLRTSMMDLGEIFKLPIVYFPRKIHLKHYSAAFSVFPLARYVLNSLLITLSATVGAMLTSSLCAFGFSRIEWRWREKVFAIVLSSMLLPSAVTIIPTFLGWKVVGLTNTYWPLITPFWFGGGAMNIFLLRQFFRTIPKSLDESAKMDGASYLSIFRWIIVPLSKPVMIVVMLFTFIASWNDFLNPIVYLNTQSKYTLSIGLQLFMTAFQTSWNQLMAAATVSVLPCIIIYIFGQKYIVEGINVTGIKG